MKEPRRSSDSIADAPVSKEWLGAFEAFGEIYDRMKRNVAPAIAVIVSYVVLVVVSDVTKVTRNLPYNQYYDLSIVLLFIFMLAVPTYALALADNKRLSLADFMRFDLLKYISLLLSGLLVGIIVGASVLAFVFPVIWTIGWFYLVSYPIVDKGTDIFGALRESRRLAKDDKAKVWGVVGATLLLSLAAGLLSWLPVVGHAVSIAFSAFMSIVSSGAAALLYRWLQHNTPEDTARDIV